MHWITSLNIDVIKGTLTLTATEDPERGTPNVEYLFRAVGAIQVDRYHDPADNVLGDLRHIEEKKLDNDHSQFRVDTGDAFVVFQAASEYKIVKR
ncbi:MAG: hypothetical protein JWP03_1386 [Phycisphaerales bacterium]|jgi:hypothetical protein|nr:hypothetical protein [Phycisphaerales bacterium]